MSQFCIQCGSPIEPGVRFCGTCGKPLDVRPQLPGAPPPMPPPPAMPPVVPPQYAPGPQQGTALAHPEPLSLSSRICQVRCDRVG